MFVLVAAAGGVTALDECFQRRLARGADTQVVKLVACASAQQA
jgi:hypothetical protein